MRSRRPSEISNVLYKNVPYAFAMVFMIFGPSQPARSDGELLLKVLSLAATAAVGMLLYLMTALYVISFRLDWWYVLTSDITAYAPSRWYLGIPLVALSNFVRPVVATPLIIVGGAHYLRQRSSFVGHPESSDVFASNTEDRHWR